MVIDSKTIRSAAKNTPPAVSYSMNATVYPVFGVEAAPLILYNAEHHDKFNRVFPPSQCNFAGEMKTNENVRPKAYLPPSPETSEYHRPHPLRELAHHSARQRPDEAPQLE